MLISLIREGRVRAVCVWREQSTELCGLERRKCLCNAVGATRLCLFFLTLGQKMDLAWWMSFGRLPFRLEVVNSIWQYLVLYIYLDLY